MEKKNLFHLKKFLGISRQIGSYFSSFLKWNENETSNDSLYDYFIWWLPLVQLALPLFRNFAQSFQQFELTVPSTRLEDDIIPIYDLDTVGQTAGLSGELKSTRNIEFLSGRTSSDGDFKSRESFSIQYFILLIFNSISQSRYKSIFGPPEHIKLIVQTSMVFSLLKFI